MESLITAGATLIGVVVGSAVTWAKDYFSNKKNVESDKRYLIIRVSCLLEKFALQCSEISYDGDINWEPITRAVEPKLEMDELDVNWKSLSPDLVYEILSLPNLKSEIELTIHYVFANHGPMEYLDARQAEYAKLGVKVIEIIEKMQGEIKLSSLDKSSVGFEWKQDLKNRKDHLCKCSKYKKFLTN